MSSVRFEPASSPASVTQEQFWILNQMHPESPAYNIPFLYRISGPLSRGALEKSINEMIRRHGVLRTCFAVEHGTLVQKTAAEMAVQIRVESGGGLTDDDANRMVTDEVRRPFVLSELPLIRFKLLRLKGGEHLFLVVMHHSITDLRTKELFTEELSTLYEAFLSGKPLTVSPAPQYTEFSRWQKGWIASDECAAMISFWREQMAGQSGRLGLPMDQERPRVISYQGEALPFHLDASFTEVLKRYSRENRVSLFQILLAAYAVLLFKYSGQSRLVIGVPLTNRRQDRFKNTMGCFVNILPLSLAFTDDTSFSELLRHVRLAMLEAHRNQELPYNLLVKALGIKREPNHNPLFQVGFTREPPYPLDLAGLDVRPVPLDRGGSQLDLFFRWWEGEEGLQGFFEYHAELFDVSSVRHFASHYQTLLRELVCDSDRSVSTLSLLPDGQRRGRSPKGHVPEGLFSQANDASRPIKRPQGGGHLSFSHPAEQIDAFVRALDFGRNHSNTMCLPKIYLSGEFVIVSGLSVLPATSKAPAGTIVAADEGALTFATESSDVSVTQLLTLDGIPFSIPEFMARFDLSVGDRIQDLDSGAMERMTELSRKLCRHEPYWQEALASFEPLSLTYAKQANPSSEEAERRTEVIPVSERVIAFIDEAAPDQSDCFLSAAFAAYLARVNDSSSFDIGIHVRSQNRDVADAMGLFSLFVPVKVKVDVGGSFAQFFKGFCGDMEARAAHKTYARDLLARIPSFSHEPDGYLPSRSDVSICWARDLDMYEELSLRNAKQSPMVLVVPEGARTLFLRYRPDCLSPYYAQSIKKQFGVFLEGLVGGLEKPLSSLPLLTEDERHRLVTEWNSTSKAYPKGMCLHHVFEAQVNRTPDIKAVTFGETALSYRELDERANQLAHHLRRFGVGPEVLVGIVMERSLEMIVGIYGILKAGGAYVPLDPDYPPDRLAYMLGDTDVPVILTQHHLLTKIPENKAHTLCLDTQWGEVAKEERAKPEDGSSPDDLAYVIYTSGSTGKPKGVMNCHNGICNRLWWMQEAYSLTRDDHVLQKTPYSFDVSVWEFFWPLQVGARLVVAPPGIHKEPAPLIDAINKERITTLHFVPSMLQAFLKDREARTCSSITRVICSGEALPYDLQERFFKTLDAELHNLYGPTEAAVDVSYYACRRDTANRVVPIGKPVSNTQLYILDRNLNPVPVGAAGELHIGGVQVARGYLNRPELTEEKFIPDRFDGDGGRLYKTGDLARYLPDGNIEYLGRNDFQIKIRGMRIELGEIEAVLCEHPEVYEAVVAADNGASGHGRVVAYYVTGAGGALSAVTLRNHLKEKLPDHMVPALFVQMEALPLLGNGKVNRKALPAPTTERPEVATQYAVPRTGVEKAISEVWKSQLGIDAVGIDDNFFEVGGDSLLLVQIANELSRTLSPDLKVHHLFEFPTIRSVAGFLDTKPDREPAGMHIEARQQKRKATLAKRNKNRRGAFK